MKCLVEIKESEDRTMKQIHKGFSNWDDRIDAMRDDENKLFGLFGSNKLGDEYICEPQFDAPTPKLWTARF